MGFLNFNYIGSKDETIDKQQCKLDSIKTYINGLLELKVNITETGYKRILQDILEIIERN